MIDGGKLERIDDALNPIFVREVRRALKSKTFFVGFILILFAAAMLGAFVINERLAQREYWEAQRRMAAGAGALVGGQPFDFGQIGKPFFMSIFMCLMAAVCGLIPFGAFFSMSTERDEATWDLLSLSSLRPHQIVLGKLWSFMAQAVLVYSAFTPFLVTGYLMHGIDLGVAALAVASSMVLCPATAAFGIMLSSLPGPKALRMILMVVFGGLLFGVCALDVAVLEDYFRRPGRLTGSDDWIGWMIAGTITVGVFVYSVAFASALLTHSEENRSTFPRVFTTVTTIAWIGISCFAYTDGDRFVTGIFYFYFVLLPCALYATEPERLGQRIARQVPGSRWKAWLGCLYLPGGGRGFLFFLAHGVFYLAFMLAFALYWNERKTGHYTPPSSDLLSVRYFGPVSAFLYTILYFGFVPTLMQRMTVSWTGRLVAFASVPVVAFLGFILPILPAMFRPGVYDPHEHYGNPLMLPGFAFASDDHGQTRWAAFLVVVILAAITVILNVPRMMGGIRTVLEASRATRTRMSSSDTLLAEEGLQDAPTES